MSFRIEMLPAQQGDALWIEYGDASRLNRVLFDAGTESTFDVLRERISSLPLGDRHFELLVVSHIDADHIGGAVPLLADRDLGVTFADVSFNGWRHLPNTPLESMGPVEGDRLAELLAAGAWNEAWGNRAVVVPPRGPPASHRLPGGLELTVVSPFTEQLAKLKPTWPETVISHGLVAGRPASAPPELGPGLETLGAATPPTPADIDVPGLASRPFVADDAAPNGTSIAVLAEYGDRGVLLTADAFPAVVLRGVERLLDDRGESHLQLDAFKLPHHGSRANLHLPLLERIKSPRQLISTNGSRTHHPNIESIARVLSTTPHAQLLFNYRSEWNEVWADPDVAARCGYEPIFPPEGGPPGKVLELNG